MKLIRCLYLSLFIFFQVRPAAAQIHDLKFKAISGPNGIAVGKINGITRDKHGVMWFADQTNRCITRYDGNLMTSYPGGNYPESILADSSGTIWIGYYGAGLDRFEPETNTYTRFRYNADDPESLSNDSITAILIDHLGKLWLGTNSGLNLMDVASGKFTRYQHNPSDPSSLSNNTIRSLYEDREGTIWAGTGLAWDSNNKGGLNRFNREQNNFTRYMHDPNNPKSLIDNKVRAIFEDSRGNLWIGTRLNGLHIVDRKEGSINRVSVDPDDANALFSAPITTPYDHFTFINEDATGSLWFGTLSNGLIRYDPVTKKSVHFSRDSNKASGFKDFSGWWCHTSPDGLMWVSTQESNLYQVDLVTNFINSNSLNKVVIDIAEESPGVCWFGTTDGLVRKNLNGGPMQQFRHDPKNENSLSSNVTISICTGSDGTLWVGTQHGLNKFNSQTQTFTRYYFNANDEQPSANDIYKVYEDSDHNLWVASNGGGLIKLDKGSGKTTRYLYDPSDTTTIRGDFINAIVQGEDKSMWVGSMAGGLNRLDPATGHFKHYLTETTVNAVYKGKAGTIWVSTDRGLYQHNRDNDTFSTVVEVNESLRGERVLSVSEDNQQNLWIVSTVAVYILNLNTRNVIRYDTENGIDTEVLLGHVMTLKNGHVLLASRVGYYEIDPEKIEIPLAIPTIYFKKISVNGELQDAGGGILHQPFSETTEIRLDHYQNAFSIDFQAIDYGEAVEKMIRYKLEGYDKEWHQLAAGAQAYYFNIPPGEYRFLAKASNSLNGIWVEKSISIKISPPWWSTVWAYLMYGVVFATCAYSVHRFQKERLVKIEREKARVRELEQAREIEKAYSTLKATQTQLIHSEKMASLGELTAGIAHEIQNPLNFVNNFSEVNRELLNEMREEIDKGNVSIAKSIAEDVIKNEEKIIHHGKRADAIVKGMLQHSQSTTAAKEPTDINALTDEYLRLAYHGWRAKDKSFNVSIKTELDDTIGSINVVPQDIGRVILNLISNAFYVVAEKKKQHSADFEPTVTVRTRKENNLILISIKDNGNGISEQIKDKIFQPFFTTKPTGQGTGLGLSLSYDIVKAHGGELTVRTEEGQGSEFVVSLPANNL